MENKKETRTNMMDLLPDVMVIRIFEHLENLTDLSTLSKVNHRFNELSKLKCNRNHLIIKVNEIDDRSLQKFQKKTLDEIKKCRDLKALTISTSFANIANLSQEYWTLMRLMTFMKSMFITLDRKTEQEIDEDDFGNHLFNMSNDEFVFDSYLKKSAGDMSRVVQMAPSAITNIHAKETPKLFQTAIEKYTDTLLSVTYVGKRTNLTLANLNALGKCKKLIKVELTANLVVCEEVPETFDSIQAKEITLKGNFHCPYFGDIFSSETLEKFSADYSTIAGFKNELLTKCTKLRFLSINMQSEREDMQNDHIIHSFVELVDTLKNHKLLEKVDIKYSNLDVKNSYVEPLSEWSRSIRGSGIKARIFHFAYSIASIEIKFKR